jgi:muramidase (phage lysozyme)
LAVEEAGGPEICAFLDMLAHAEIGDALLAKSDDGYNVLVGSTAAHPNLFTSYDRHPAKFIELRNLGIKSSAAGRYQILFRTVVGLATRLHVTDFKPETQDRCAIELICGRGALDYVKTGRIELAITTCSKEWASLPGAGYGQPERALSDLLGAYHTALPKYRQADFSNVESGVDSTATKVNATKVNP